MNLTAINVLGIQAVERTFISPYPPTHYNLFYLFSEKGQLTVNGRIFHCDTNDCFLFRALNVLVPESNTRKPLSLLHLVFTCSDDRISGLLDKMPPKLIDSPQFRPLFFSIMEEMTHHSPICQDTVGFKVIQVLLPSLKDSVNIKPATSKDDETLQALSTETPNTLKLITSFFQNHYDENFALANVCEDHGISIKQLNTYMNKTFGKPAKQYIAELRLQKAKELLCFSSLSVTEIAGATGFSNVHYFSSYFKQKEGIAPEEYKKNLSRFLKPNTDFSL